MRRRSVLLVPAIALASALTFVPAAPAEAAPLKVGIGDQSADTFSNSLFTRSLRVKRTRLIAPWDAANTAAGRASVRAWMTAARKRRMEIMVAFNHSSGDACPAKPCRAPSTRSYQRAVKRFHRLFRRYGVKIYQPWNESNSRTQPTSGNRGARKVAAYYRVLVRMCGRRCTVTGADIQDIGAYTKYTKVFLRAVGRRKPKIMGLHNYSDTNRRGYRRTAAFVRAMPRGTKIWLTETGGIYSFQQQDGTVSLPASESRQARSMSHMFRIQRRYRRVIDRIYVYQWRKTNSFDRFDAGVVNFDGTPRRAYRVLRKYRRYFR